MKKFQPFMIDNHVSFEQIHDALPPCLILESDASRCVVSIYGGQVLSFIPKGTRDLLWVSRNAVFEPGKAIRGGIPVCWPWFGPHPEYVSKPSHGFARIREWALLETGVKNGIPFALLALKHDTTSPSLFEHPFRLEILIEAGKSLTVSLTTHNPGDEPFTLTEALHTYFGIDAIGDASIGGVEKQTYLDQLRQNRKKSQEGLIRFTEETDRVYINTQHRCILKGGSRRIAVEKAGSLSTVIWNPWIQKAKRMSDFGDEEYQKMVCIETANAAQNRITVQPGESHTIRLNIKEIT